MRSEDCNALFNGGTHVKAAVSIDVQAIRADELYRLDDFKALSGLGSHAMLRTPRRAEGHARRTPGVRPWR